MAKYAYPAIFTKEAEGYSVEFPDVPGCATSGVTLPEAMEMAEDALCLMLYDLEESDGNLPASSDLRDVRTEGNAVASLVCCDTLEYRKLYNNKAVKKTLSIPAWLNTMAEKADINFSTVLQNALKKQLGV